MTSTQVTDTPPESQLRVSFFDYLFNQQRGHLCIATASKNKGNWVQKFFDWPTQRHVVANYLDAQATDTHDVWFCVNLLSAPERKKEFCLPTTIAWADLDTVDPSTIVPVPTCVVESSPGRWQSYWRIEGEPIPPDIAEDYSKRIAYAVSADKSGWDLTQLLRVPWTKNQKYDPPVDVKLISVVKDAYPIEVFDALPVATADNPDAPPIADMPVIENLPPVDNVLYRYKSEGKVDPEFASLYSVVPDSNADWSKVLWRFLHKCFNMGMNSEEVFTLAIGAGCNKYIRDNRPLSYLWRDVLKAAAEHDRFDILLGGKVEIITMPHLVDFDDIEEDSFIRDYKTWANNATDAPEQYHELSCFITLSAVISAGLYLKVKWGEIVPNIWGL